MAAWCSLKVAAASKAEKPPAGELASKAEKSPAGGRASRAEKSPAVGPASVGETQRTASVRARTAALRYSPAEAPRAEARTRQAVPAPAPVEEASQGEAEQRVAAEAGQDAKAVESAAARLPAAWAASSASAPGQRRRLHRMNQAMRTR